MIRHKNGNNAMAAQTEFHLRALVLAGHAHAGMHRARCATLSISLSLSLSLSLCVSVCVCVCPQLHVCTRSSVPSIHFVCTCVRAAQSALAMHSTWLAWKRLNLFQF